MEENRVEIDDANRIGVGPNGNAYGGLCIAKQDEKFYWGIWNELDEADWEEIPEELYNTLLKYADE